jgi:hypothetical protein
MHDAFADDLVAFGAKVGAEFSGVNVMAAYSNVNDGGLDTTPAGADANGMFNIGGTTSALYTETALDQVSPVNNTLRSDMDKFVVSASTNVLGGSLAGVYAYTDGTSLDTEVNEFDVVYSTNVAGLDLTAAYVYADVDATDYDGVNLVRVVLGYNF